MHTRNRTYRFLIAVFAFALIGSIAASSAVAVAPSTPLLTYARVTGLSLVTLTWNPSTDSDGVVVGYDIYRATVPITGTNVGGLIPIAVNVTTNTVDVTVAAGEAAGLYTHYYSVVAVDDAAERSIPARNVAPGIHGTSNDGVTVKPNVEDCRVCHSTVHNIILDKTKEFCYVCHGGTAAATGWGAGSTLNVQSGFADYIGQTAGSRHRSASMTTNEKECGACHSPHRSGYYRDETTGIYDPTRSFVRALRAETASGWAYFSQASDPQGNLFCLACHGSDAWPIENVGGAVAYDNSGGDHNDAGFSSSAHGEAVVLPSASIPGISCTVCHSRHASAAEKLLDYRESGTTDATSNSESGLCFKCHSASSSETNVAGTFAAPFSWNNRDVQAELTGRASAHPYESSATGASTSCASCHNVHYTDTGAGTAWDDSRYTNPDDTAEFVSTTVYGSTTSDFCVTCHDGTPPAASISSAAVVPYDVAFSTVAAPYFPGWDKAAAGVSFADSGHSNAATTPALCENCHDPHASDFTRLTAWTRPAGAAGLAAGSRENTSAALSSEENLCYRCHGNGTVGDQATDAVDVATKALLADAHDPSDTTGTHDDTETASDLGTRHAECTDCHDAHAARLVGGTATQDSLESTAGGALYGAFGVTPTYPASNWTAATAYTAERLNGGATDYEAYLCFKCHSPNTTQPAAQTDIALQFNPSNFSYHNVLGQAVGIRDSFTVTPVGDTTPVTVTWLLPDETLYLKSGLTGNTMLTCTSCHTNDQNSGTQAKGPHGSSMSPLLDPDYATDWRTGWLDASSATGMTGGIICEKCHDLTDGADWSNTAHDKAAHQNSSDGLCINCHTGIPHGWKRPRLLGYVSDPAPYATSQLVAISVDSRSATGWSSSDCQTGCQHNRAPRDIWP